MSNVNPDLAAILDAEGPSDEAVVEQPEPAEADLHEEPTADEPEAAPTAEPEHPENVPWDDHVKLRHENEAYRKRFQPMEKAFEGIDPEDAQALLNLAQTYRDNPAAAAGMMREYAEMIEGGATHEEAMDAVDPGGPKYLTADDLNRVLTEREQKAAFDETVRSFERDAETLGYNPKAEDAVEASRYVQLLSIASKNGGDLQAAHKAMTAERQSIIDEYLKAKAAESNGTPAPQMGVTPSGERSIADDPNPMKAADRATRELFAQQ